MIKVSVLITTYNLKDYISEALDSVLKQKTTFSYEIRIADDASTDGTAETLKEYQARYPDIIHLILNKKNLGSLANSNQLFDNLQCEYFSFLDGDDVWVDEYRLQKQVDFLEEHKDHAICAGQTVYIRDGKPCEKLINEEYLNNSFTFDDCADGTMPFVHTSSMLVRNCVFGKGLPQIYKDAVGTFYECALRGEDYRRYLHLKYGKAYIMSDLVSYYRIHDRGMWQGSSEPKRRIEGVITLYKIMESFAKDGHECLEESFKKSFSALQKYLLTNDIIFPLVTLSEKEQFIYYGLMNDIVNKYGKDYIEFSWKKCCRKYDLLNRLHLTDRLL